MQVKENYPNLNKSLLEGVERENEDLNEQMKIVKN